MYPLGIPVCTFVLLCHCVYPYRHWQQLSDELGMMVQPKPTLTFSKCLEMGLEQHIETIAKVAEVAAKEFSIEQVTYTYSVTTYNSFFKYWNSVSIIHNVHLYDV